MQVPLITPPRFAGDAVLGKDAQFSAGVSLVQGLASGVGLQLCLELGGGTTHASLLNTAAFAGLLASGGYAGWRRGEEPVRLWWSHAGAALALGVAPLALLLPGAPMGSGSPAASLLLGLLALSVVLTGLGSPLVSSAYATLYPVAVRGRAVAYTRLIHGLSGVCGTALFASLVARDQRWAFVLYPLVAVLATVTCWRFVTTWATPAGGRTSTLAGQLLALRNPGFFGFQLYQFILGIANLMANPLLAVYIRERLQLDFAVAVWVAPQGVVEQAMRLLSIRLHGYLYERLGVVAHRVLTSCLIAIGLLCWAYATDLTGAVIAAAVIGLARAGGQIVWLIGSLEFAPHGQESDYAAVHTLLTGVRGVIAPMLGVAILDHLLHGDYQTMMLGCAAVAAMSVLGHATVKAPQRRSDTHSG
jgi:hypothetical protein